MLNLEIESELEIRGGHVTFELKTTEGTRVTLVVSLDAGFEIFAGKGQHLITCALNELALPPGQYLGDVAVAGSVTAKCWDVILNYPLFKVVDRLSLVSHWPDRPWAAVHCHDVIWNQTSVEGPFPNVLVNEAASGGPPIGVVSGGLTEQ